MIPKITRGSNSKGLVRYLFSKGRHNEHSNQNLVCTSDDMFEASVWTASLSPISVDGHLQRHDDSFLYSPTKSFLTDGVGRHDDADEHDAHQQQTSKVVHHPTGEAVAVLELARVKRAVHERIVQKIAGYRATHWNTNGAYCLK